MVKLDFVVPSKPAKSATRQYSYQAICIVYEFNGIDRSQYKGGEVPICCVFALSKFLTAKNHPWPPIGTCYVLL